MRNISFLRVAVISVFGLASAAVWPKRPATSNTSANPAVAPSASSVAAKTFSPAQPQPNAVAVPVPKASPPAVAQFAAWTEKLLAAPDVRTKATLTAEGEVLARQRREAIAELIQTDPKLALESAVPFAVRQQLPDSITRQLEERVSGRGFYGVLVATDFEKGRSEVTREVVMGDQTYRAYVYGARAAQTTGQSVPLWGIAVPQPDAPENSPKLLAIHEDPVRPAEPGEILPPAKGDELCPVSAKPAQPEIAAEVAGRFERFCGARHINKLNERLAADIAGTEGGGGGGEPPIAQDSWSQGPKTCLYMRVAFPDDPTEPITEDGAYAAMDSVNQWFVENSFNSTEIISTVTPLLMLPQTKAWYSVQGTSRLLSDSRDAARDAGLDTDNYNWDIVRHGSVPGFNYGGLGYVRGKGTWLQSSSVGVTVHELGHNYGIWHANFWVASGDSVIGPGSNSEYGNSFDTMGAASAGNNQFNAEFKNELDWLPLSFVQTVTNSGTYRLWTFDVPGIVTGQKYALRIKKNYDRNYWAEFRQKFSANRWFLNGVILNWDPWNNGVVNSASGTHLLDTTPGTPTANSSKEDCAVLLGRTFTDAAAGVHITPIARGNGSPENWIDVTVNLGDFAGNHAPVATLIADRTSAALNANINFSANATDADGDPLAYLWDFGDWSIGPNAASVTKSWATNGEYVVRCSVSDMKGGVFSKHIVVAIGTVTTFRVSGRVTTDTGAPVEGVRVHNGGSTGAYRGAYTDSDGNYVIAGLAAGSHTIASVKYGYALAPAGFANPVTVGPNATGKNFTAIPDPVVSITAADPSASEAGTDPGTFTIARTGPTGSPLTVKFNRTGTAVTGSDYNTTPALSGTPLQIVIAGGVASTNITIAPINDTSAEGPETVTLTLMEDTAYVLGSLAEATITVADNESPSLPVVDLSATNPSGLADNLAPESGEDSGAFTFTRIGGTAGELTVLYSVTGTASNGVDYSTLSGVFVIPAGESAAALPFRVIDDVEIEGLETVTVTILASGAYGGAGDTTTITIVDDDPPTVSVYATDNTARESGASPGAFTITRVGNLAPNLVVNYTLAGTATNTLDCSTLSGTVTILAGRATATVTVTPVNDALVEGDETLVLVLLGTAAYNVGNPGSATVIIVDDEIPSVTLTASDNTASEPGSDTGTYTFSRTGSTAAPLTVYFSVGGTAINGADYSTIDNTFIIPGGSASATLTITPLNDAVLESSERVTVTLSEHPSYTLGTIAPQTVTINDNDAGALPGVGFTFASSGEPEGFISPRLSVTLSSALTTPVTVNYAVTGGSASGGGVDYTLANGTLTIPTNAFNASLNLVVINDTNVEADETIVVTLSSPSGAVLDANSVHTYTIFDDDAHGAVTVSAPDPNASETGPDTGFFRIARSTPNTNALTVYCQIVGSASSPSDYLPVPMASATIPAGASFVDLIVTPVDDATDETNETVILTLQPTPGARIGSPDTATVTITDNDDSTNSPVIAVVATDATASEPGADTGTFTFTRDRDTNSALTVNFTVGGNAVSGSDFNAIGTSITFAPGATGTNLTLTARDDSTFESNETVVVTLTLQGGYRVGAPASATVVIVDNETGISITANGNSAEDGSSTGTFTITRTGSTNANLNVGFAAAGTAIRGTDYTSFGLSATIPAGTNSVTLPVAGLNDALPEGTETVAITLNTSGSYTITAPSSATLLIFDDEPAVSIAATDDTAYEAGSNPGEFILTRSGNTNADLTVNLTISGTASNGVDYTVISNSAVIPAGATETVIALTPINDVLVEGNETVQLTIVSNAAYAVLAPGGALATIVDDEVNLLPTVAITSPTVDVAHLVNTSSVLLLEAAATDDGRPNPPGALTLTWSRVSGPGTVNFGSLNATSTTATFSTNGIYVLRITASDGQLQATDEVTIVVAADQSLLAGLQAYWRLDETNGASALDASANNRTATVSGATIVPGRFNSARDFDGVDDVASFSAPALTQLTFSAWVYSDTTGDSTTPRIIAMPGYNVRVRRGSGTANTVALESERSTTTGEWRMPGDTIFDGGWYHVVVAYDSANVANVPVFYLNGINQAATERTAPVGVQDANTGTGYLGNSAALDRSWDGRLDEVRIYNRMLTAEEIQLLYTGSPTNVAPTVDAGPDLMVRISSQIYMNATVADDGQPNPPGAPINQWSKLSGPGTVEFADDASEATLVTFSAAGNYVLRLTAHDGQVKIVDDIAVTVIDPPSITIAASTNVVGEMGLFLPGAGTQLQPGFITLLRTGPTNAAVTVFWEIGGTAGNGTDYSLASGPLVIAAGATSNRFYLFPIRDTLAEGDETIVLTLQSNLFYDLGAMNSATVTIKDVPWDEWRFGKFTPAELTNSSISGEQADIDLDGLITLFEYAFNREPKTFDTTRSFTGAMEIDPGDSQEHLVITFTRRKAPTDLDYLVQVTSDLANWTSGTGVVEEILPPTDDGNGVTETARYRVLAPAGTASPRFVRLQLRRR